MKLNSWVNLYIKERHKIQKKIFAPKIFFFYFHPVGQSYTPLDVGYIMAKIEDSIKKRNVPLDNFKFEIIPIYFGPKYLESENKFVKDFDTKKETERILELLKKNKPKAVFFFLDNILWSGFWGVGRSLELAELIKKYIKKEDIFIGFQSYKITKEITHKAFNSKVLDCWIGENPAESFLQIERIIKKEKVENVYYDCNEIDNKENSAILQKNFFNQKCSVGEKNVFLDEKFPSPYLNGALDGFLFPVKKRKNFICFTYSSFGCVFGCYYCFRSVKFEKLQLFSPKRFFDEIEYLILKFGFSNFTILDDCFAISKERLKDLVEEFESRKINNPKLKSVKLIVMSRIEVLEDEERIRLLKKLNIVKIQIGLQTINPKLDIYMRRIEGLAKKLELIKKWLSQEEILFSLDIIAGLPGDDLKNFKKTVDFALSLNPSFVQVKRLYLNPNTFFHLRQEEFGIVAEDFLTKKLVTPLVVKSDKIDNIYFEEAYKYSMAIAKKNPEIGFKFLFKEEYFFRPDKKMMSCLFED